MRGRATSVVRMASIALALGLGATACASTDEQTTADRLDAAVATTGPQAQGSVTSSGGDGPATVAAALPAVEVVDLATGGNVRLDELPTSGKPMLLWMWAPY